MIPDKVFVKNASGHGKLLTIRQWFDGEAEWFRANFMASEHPGPFAWTYFIRCAIRVLEIVS